MAKQPVAILESAEAGHDFIDLPYRLYADDPAWRAPLRLERRQQLDPRSNPAAAKVDACFFLAKRGEDSVGRIAAFTNAAHDAHHGSDTAFFGYFDCADDREVEDALLGAAIGWARSTERSKLIGPCMWSVNEEVGLLIDGFEHPNVIMMPYGRPHQIAAVERNGFEKSIDLNAFLADLREGAPQGRLIRKLCQAAIDDPGLTWRSLDRKNFKGDVKIAMNIFNDAWSENWGFIPFTEELIDHMAKEMKPIMFDEGFQVGFMDGEPVTFVWMIPDVNAAAAGLNGKLLPFGWAKLLYRLKTKKVKRGRIPLMGLKRDLHKSRRGVALTTRICSLAFDAGKRQGFDECELSWILEGNRSMEGICAAVNAPKYKTYRMYERKL